MICCYCGMAPQWLQNAFLEYGVKLIEIGRSNALSEPVAHHIDLMALQTERVLYVTPETTWVGERIRDNFTIITSHLGSKYPEDVPLNAVFLKNHLICNTNTVSKELLDYATGCGKQVIHVNQGYTNCSCCVVSDTAIITEDKSIYTACEGINDLSVLLVDKGHVSLPGLNYGFIGGASVFIGDTVYFFGNITSHPNYKQIHDFITSQDKKLIALSLTDELLDIGGVITLDC